MEESYGLEDYDKAREPIYSVDPVCGTKVRQDLAPASSEYDGERIYFCSDACKNAFDDDPLRYWKQTA